jgi:hypothetical protein
MSELLDLAVFAAVAKTARKSETLLEDLGIVEARAAVTIKDRNKVKNPDEQSLVLVFARRNLSLEAVSRGCTHLVVPAPSVEGVTAQLAGLVFDGKFDAEILAIQALVKETKAKKATKTALIDLETVAVNDEVINEVTVEAVPVVAPTSATPILDSIKSHTNTPPNIDGLDLGSIT